MQKYKIVKEFLDDLSQDKKDQVEELRSLIKSSHPDLQEIIKWNAPSYVLHGEDRITFNLLNKEDQVKLVLHMGAVRKEDKKAEPIMNDSSGLIKWNSDIRGMIMFKDLEDVRSKRDAVSDIIKRWLAIQV